jgi:hypothetical protein
MIKRICAALLLVLILITLNAQAETIPYTFGDFTFQIPDSLYVLTRDQHDVEALGLEVNISQHFADLLFEPQYGLQMDCMRIEPFYEIAISQLPITGMIDFSSATPEQMDENWNVLKDDLKSKQVDIREKMEVLSTSQTNFFYYRGITEISGSTIYVNAYATCENNILTTVMLKTYDDPEDESFLTVLNDIVQDTVLN